MKSELARQVLSIIESEVRGRHSPMEFEMAYQARVAAERIRFVIKTIEQSPKVGSGLEEASLQLLDALDRLDSADRNFQRRFHLGCAELDNGAHQEMQRLGSTGVARANHDG